MPKQPVMGHDPRKFLKASENAVQHQLPNHAFHIHAGALQDDDGHYNDNIETGLAQQMCKLLYNNISLQCHLIAHDASTLLTGEGATQAHHRVIREEQDNMSICCKY